MLFLPALGSEAVCAPGLPPLQSPHLRQGKGPGGFCRNQHSPQSRAFLSEELPPSSAGCTPAPSLARCNTCRFLGHHKLPGHHAGHPPQTQGHAAGHRHLLGPFPSPPSPSKISPCPRAQGTCVGPAAPGTERPPSSRGSPGGRGGRQRHSRRPGTGTPPRSCRSQWSAQSASQWAAATAVVGREAHV